MKRAASCAVFLLISLAAGCQSQPAYVAVPPPPSSSASVEVRGYQEGYRMGVKDVQHGRRFEVARHSPFQVPPVPQEDWDAYRAAYAHGYRAAYGKEPLRPPEPMTVAPAPSADPQERGYDDGHRMGIEDVQAGREFEVTRHSMFRYPPVAASQEDTYRNAYQYGYRVAYGMEPPPEQEQSPPQNNIKPPTP